MANNRKNYFRLGLFVCSAVIICAVSIFLLLGPNLFRPTVMVETYFKSSISGLEVGSPVKFRGIEVGQVKQIQLSTEAYPQQDQGVLSESESVAVVRMELYMSKDTVDSEFTQFIDQGLRLQTQLAGITGSLYLSAEFLNPEKYPKDRLSYHWEPLYPVIPSAPSLSNEIVDNVKNFLADLDDMHIEETLNETIPLIQSLLKNVDRIAESVNPQLLNNVGGNLDTLLKTANSKLSEFDIELLNKLIEEIDAATQNFKSLTAKTETKQLIQSLTNLSNRLNAVLDNNQYDFKQILANLNRVIENLQSLTQELTNDPGILFTKPRMPPEPPVVRSK